MIRVALNLSVEVGGVKLKCKEGSDRLSRELKKLDSSVNCGGKKALKEARSSKSLCERLFLGMLGPGGFKS